MTLLDGLGLSLAAPARASAAGLDTVSSAAPARGYACLNRTEGAFTEALVNVLCPEDHLTPNGVACGLAVAVDRQFAGDARPQLESFKHGIAAATRACKVRFGSEFEQLSPDDAAQFFRALNGGELDDQVNLSSWIQHVVNPVLVRACFAGEIYDTQVLDDSLVVTAVHFEHTSLKTARRWS